jgi:hypothetical protein
LWCLLRDEVLGVLQLTLEPPDHVVQGVELGGSAVLTGGPGSPITLPTTDIVAPPQVFPTPWRVLLIGLGPHRGTLHDTS